MAWFEYCLSETQRGIIHMHSYTHTQMQVHTYTDAGPFMSLTLLRPSSTEGRCTEEEITSLFGKVQNNKVSKPAPVTKSKNMELDQQALSTLKSMHEQALCQLEKLKMEVQKNPTEYNVMMKDNQLKVVMQLENKISQFGDVATAANSSNNSSHNSHNSLLPGILRTFWHSDSNNSLLSPQTTSTDIISMEGFDTNGDEDTTEPCLVYKEFEDLNLLKQSPLHLSVFLKYLIDNANSAYMPLNINLPVQMVQQIEASLRNYKESNLRVIFHNAINHIQEDMEKQLAEYQHYRRIGFGKFSGDDYLPKPTAATTSTTNTTPTNLSNSSLYQQQQQQQQQPSTSSSTALTAPVAFQSLTRPPLSYSSSSVTTSSTGPPNLQQQPPQPQQQPQQHPPLSSSSFSSSSNPFLSNSLANRHQQLHASSSSSSLSSLELSNIEKILWDVFSYLADDKDDNKLAIAVSLATFFRQVGLQVSRSNQALFENFPSFVCKEKRALKNRMKKLTLKGHQLQPHQYAVFVKVECKACMQVIWGVGYQCYKYAVSSSSSSGVVAPWGSNSLPHKRKIRIRNAGSDVADRQGSVLSDSEATLIGDGDPMHSLGTPLPFNLSGFPGQFNNTFSKDQPAIPAAVSRAEFVDSDPELERELPPLSAVISSDQLALLDSKARKRQDVINEILYTERSYLRTLKIMSQMMLKPMREDPNIDTELANHLMPNLENLIEMHKNMNAAIKECKKDHQIVSEIGLVLLKWFSGENKANFEREYSEFCRDQYYYLGLLAEKQKQDPYLAQFLNMISQKNVCRKMALKDFLPKIMQRLTKYPLLVDTVLKVTPPNTTEHQNITMALENLRAILSYVNQVIKECENFRHTQEMQKRLDTKSIENVNHPVLIEYRNLNLTERKLIFDGELQWYPTNSTVVKLHIALFEDILIIMHKVDNKLVLKCQSTGIENVKSKFMQVPIIKLSHLMIKDVPRDPKSFYLVSASKEDSQMYKLVASTTILRNNWTKNIREAVEHYKNQYSAQQPRQSVIINSSSNNNNNSNISSSTSSAATSATTVTTTTTATTTTSVSATIDSLSSSLSSRNSTFYDNTDAGFESSTANDSNENERGESEDASAADLPTSPISPEDELKWQIIATYELMVEKLVALSEMHHLASSIQTFSRKSLPPTLDSNSFIQAINNILDEMIDFFSILPDDVIDDASGGGKTSEWDPVESLLELGQRLEMLVKQLQELVQQRDLITSQYSHLPPPPPPDSEPPLS
ncbi:hypothetical protein HELRODRAFT_189723 [Helobdella robusta]|uniref:DH domain-containing protein n=1 Tax=Helobdella robusta TaxID=6412 RepID=T1FRA7_HELRO|nr:hypothetical protein HELRODRAFT_189723 [Helobdella robusta]ESN91560.1 hypothetical protein HELRODRAFT_189723 [Helobdella robusta]